MLRSKIKKNTGVAGMADVRVLKHSLQVHFLEEDDVYDVALEGWEREGGRYNIVLEKTNDKVKYISPPARAEPYYVKFAGFGNRQNDIPEPKKKPGGMFPNRDGSGMFYRPDAWVASVKQEVLEAGLYQGLIIPFDFPYIFAHDPVSGAAMLEGRPAEIRRVEEYLRVTGFDFSAEDIPFQTNILPWLEVRLLAADKIYTNMLNEKGYVESVQAAPAFVDLSALLGKNGKKSNGKKSNGKTNGTKKTATKPKAKKAA